MGQNRKREIDEAELVELVLWFQGVSPENFLSESHRQKIVFARVLITFMLTYEGYGGTRVSRIVHRDHASVTHYKKIIVNDLTFRRVLRRFTDYMQRWEVFVPTIERWEKKEAKRKKEKTSKHEPKIMK